MEAQPPDLGPKAGDELQVSWMRAARWWAGHLRQDYDEVWGQLNEWRERDGVRLHHLRRYYYERRGRVMPRYMWRVCRECRAYVAAERREEEDRLIQRWLPFWRTLTVADKMALAEIGLPEAVYRVETLTRSEAVRCFERLDRLGGVAAAEKRLA